MQHEITLGVVANARYYGSKWESIGPSGNATLTTGVYSGTQHYTYMRFGDSDGNITWPVPYYANIVSATLRFYVSDGTDNSGYTHHNLRQGQRHALDREQPQRRNL